MDFLPTLNSSSNAGWFLVKVSIISKAKKISVDIFFLTLLVRVFPTSTNESRAGCIAPRKPAATTVGGRIFDAIPYSAYEIEKRIYLELLNSTIIYKSLRSRKKLPQTF